MFDPIEEINQDADKRPIGGAEIFIRNDQQNRTNDDGVATIFNLKYHAKEFFKVKRQGYQSKSGIHVKPQSNTDTTSVTVNVTLSKL